MFTAIARLLFGGEEKVADDGPASGEVVDEDWLLLNHREAEREELSAEGDQGPVQINATTSTPALSGHSDPNPENGSGCGDLITSPPPPDVVLPRPSEQEVLADRCALIAGILQDTASRAAGLAKVTHASRVQRAQAWEDRHQLARSNLQRQNCVHGRSQSLRSHKHSSTFLQQPGYTH